MKIENLHRWDVSPSEAVELQRNLKERIDFIDLCKKIDLVAGADVSFSKEKNLSHAAVSVFSFPKLKFVEIKTATLPLRFPYIAGLLSFREGPVLLKCLEKIENEPDLILFDGQGVMHPRRMGIATHLGILLDRATAGCAKSPLYGKFKQPADSKGAYAYVRDRSGEIIGACLRTKNNINPLFVSAGNKISLSMAIDIVLRCTTKYRIPEPLRCAHRAAAQAKTGKTLTRRLKE